MDLESEVSELTASLFEEANKMVRLFKANAGFVFVLKYCRAVINGKAGKSAVLPKFSDIFTLSQPGGGALCVEMGFYTDISW